MTIKDPAAPETSPPSTYPDGGTADLAHFRAKGDPDEGYETSDDLAVDEDAHVGAGRVGPEDESREAQAGSASAAEIVKEKARDALS